MGVPDGDRGAGQRLPPHPGSSLQRGTVLRPSSVLEGDRLDPQVLVQGGLSCKKPVSGATSRSQQLLWWAALAYPALWSSQNPPPCHPQTPFFHGSEGRCCSPARCCACQAGHQSRSPQDPAPSCWLPQWQSGGWEPRQLMQGPGKGGTGQRPTSPGRPGPLPPFLRRHSHHPLVFARPPQAPTLRTKPEPDRGSQAPLILPLPLPAPGPLEHSASLCSSSSSSSSRSGLSPLREAHPAPS